MTEPSALFVASIEIEPRSRQSIAENWQHSILPVSGSWNGRTLKVALPAHPASAQQSRATARLFIRLFGVEVNRHNATAHGASTTSADRDAAGKKQGGDEG